MAAILEREVKLRFDDPETARGAVLAAGGTPIRGRRLQEDCLLDTEDERLRRRRSVLRVRMESGRSFLTFKGPVQPSVVKVREELETFIGDGTLMLRVLEELGFRVWFRYQKYREEFALDDVMIAIDETPVGTFVVPDLGDGDTAILCIRRRAIRLDGPGQRLPGRVLHIKFLGDLAMLEIAAQGFERTLLTLVREGEAPQRGSEASYPQPIGRAERPSRLASPPQGGQYATVRQVITGDPGAVVSSTRRWRALRGQSG